MIYLVTLNPAIDKYIYLKNFKENITNIYEEQKDIFGGKAINVGKILNQFIKDYEIITTIDKKYNNFIKEQTKELNINFFEVQSVRENYKISNLNKITELNKKTLNLSEKVRKEIKDYLLSNVSKDDYILFAGSVSNEDVKFIKNICTEIETNKIIVDSASFNLLDIKEIKPLMIKPNEEEIEILLKEKISIEEGMSKILGLGVENVVVTLGKEGSYYKNADLKYKINGIEGNVINTVGAGDSFVGGFILGKYLKKNIQETLRLATACGSATAFSNGIAKKDLIEEIIQKVEIS